MTSLERRLRETETALYAALLTLDEQGAIDSDYPHLLKLSTAAWPQQSKAESLEEWNHLPLQTSEHLETWLRSKQHVTSAKQVVPSSHWSGGSQPQTEDLSRTLLPQDQTHTQSSTPSIEIGGNPSHSDHEISPAPSNNIIRQLKTLNPPNAPNSSKLTAKVPPWHNYF